MASNRQIRRSGRLSDRFTNSLRRRAVDARSPINPFVKYFLFFVNFFLLAGGIAAIVFSSYILVEKDKSIDHIIYFIFDPACLTCLLGGIITLLSFLGAYGALRENMGFLQAYYILFSILLLLEIILIVLVFVFFFVDNAFSDMGLYPEDTIKEAILKYRDDDDMRGFIDDIQDLLSCCGYSKDDEGYLNWNENRYFFCNTTDPSDNKSPEACSVPYSCCKIKEGENINYQCGKHMLNPLVITNPGATINVKGCLMGLDEAIKDNIWVVGGIIIAVFFIQMVFIWFAKALVSQIEEQKMKW